MLRSEGFFGFKENNLSSFAKLEYKSVSHNCNKAVIAAYYNVKKYGYEFDENYIKIDQNRRTVYWIVGPNFDMHVRADKPTVFISEYPISKKLEKEVCYELKSLFSVPSTAVSRGLKFADRADVSIVDYKKDATLDLLYNGWKQTKEADPKTFLMTFNPARYYRTYELADFGFAIYQKLILIRGKPYAVINFALQGGRAFELSFLSLFKDPELKIVNDQNDCIIVHCLGELYARGIKYVNLGTDAGIKGLKVFKHKHPSFEQIVYRA